MCKMNAYNRLVPIICGMEVIDGDDASFQPPTRGLLVDQHWIDRILSHGKCWEVRGDNTKTRSTIGYLTDFSTLF